MVSIVRRSAHMIGVLGAMLIARFSCFAVAFASSGCATTESPFADAITSAESYSAVYADGVTSNSDVLKDPGSYGLPGYVGFENGEVLAVSIRLSPDGQQAFISIDDAPEVEFDVKRWGGSTYGTWSNDTGAIYLSFASDTDAMVDISGDLAGAGAFGLMTAPADLPYDVAVFTGGWSARGGDGSAAGSIALSIDFGGGDLTGVLSGTLSTISGEQAFFTGLEGALSGSRIVGRSSVETADVSGGFALMGGVYDDAQTLAGGIAGNLNRVAFGGRFEATR